MSATKPPSLPSDDEKKLGVEPGEVVESGANDGLPPDPDAGLSDEERAAIVCRLVLFFSFTTVGRL